MEASLEQELVPCPWGGGMPCAGRRWVHWTVSEGDPADLHGASRPCSVVHGMRGGGRGHAPPLEGMCEVRTGEPDQKAGQELTCPGGALGAGPRGLEVGAWRGGEGDNKQRGRCGVLALG